MAKEYIEREALLKKLSSIVVTDDFNGTMLAYGIDIATDIILKTSPGADVVEAVRCKDCKYWMGQAYAYRCKRHSYLDYHTYTRPDAFCSFAKRRENGDK